MTGSDYCGPRAPEGEVWLDISRLLYRVFRGKITGIDRVEIAYAEQLLDAVPEQARFVAYDYWRGSFRAMPRAPARVLVREIGPAWRAGDMAGVSRRALQGLLRSIFTAPALPRYRGGARPTYINVSNHPLHLVDRVGRMTARTGAVFIPLVHDLIPLEMPEYVPPAWVGHHRARLRTIAAHADGIISNSESTTLALRKHIPRLPIATIALGTRILTAPAAMAPGSAYFVMLGTIEPRKNHLLLLHIWRRLVREYGIGAPDLHIVGRRGWENEQIVDILERCGDIAGHVHEHGMVGDGELAGILAGARALLMPSFAEGYGLPIVEALAMGVPVLCSDLGAHREIGKGVPEFLDPLDGPAWMRMIMDYVPPQSEARAAQKARLAGWRAPAWSEHMAAVLDFAARVEPRRPAVQSNWSRMMLATSVSSTQAMKPASTVSAVASQRTG